jgi:hypothetical protein
MEIFPGKNARLLVIIIQKGPLRHLGTTLILVVINLLYQQPATNEPAD